VNTFPEVTRDPQVQHNRSITAFDHPTAGKFRTIGPPIKFSRTPSRVQRPPLAGEHSVEILKEVGYTDQDIAEFSRDQVI
jgi:crotonobetainyl-CoA:carnitine CoA-transferase CaiB-like acyl-CoA transferase